jgi:uncharacterized protein YcgI (DUF1989 family)
MDPGDEFRIAPRGYHAFRIASGATLRITDVEGRQCCDFVCFAAADPRDRFSPHVTLMRNKTISLTKGHLLYSSRHHEMFAITDDTVGTGGHDVLAGMCSQGSNEAKFGVTGTPNCTANLTAALSTFDVPPEYLTGAFNVFMNMNIDREGGVSISEPRSGPGDHIDLRAELDCIVAISNCPQEWGPTNARRPSPIDLHVL